MVCDYAAAAAERKPMIIGVWEAMFFPFVENSVGVMLPDFSVALSIGCGQLEPDVVTVGLRLMDADGRELGVSEGVVRVSSLLQGVERIANISHSFRGVLLPSTTSGYVFEVLADGQRIGEIPFDIVIQAEPSAKP
jgi:hypothetical protein